MDVVRRNIHEMRGKIRISSVEGHGSTSTIFLPLTLAIIEGVIIKVGSQRFVDLSAACVNLSGSRPTC
jgi:two-component system chemotaxis sensor kinase CheA